LGVRAPDMYKPVEHVFAFLKRGLHGLSCAAAATG